VVWESIRRYSDRNGSRLQNTAYQPDNVFRTYFDADERLNSIRFEHSDLLQNPLYREIVDDLQEATDDARTWFHLQSKGFSDNILDIDRTWGFGENGYTGFISARNKVKRTLRSFPTSEDDISGTMARISDSDDITEKDFDSWVTSRRSIYKQD